MVSILHPFLQQEPGSFGSLRLRKFGPEREVVCFADSFPDLQEDHRGDGPLHPSPGVVGQPLCIEELRCHKREKFFFESGSLDLSPCASRVGKQLKQPLRGSPTSDCSTISGVKSFDNQNASSLSRLAFTYFASDEFGPPFQSFTFSALLAGSDTPCFRRKPKSVGGFPSISQTLLR